MSHTSSRTGCRGQSLALIAIGLGMLSIGLFPIAAMLIERAVWLSIVAVLLVLSAGGLGMAALVVSLVQREGGLAVVLSLVALVLPGIVLMAVLFPVFARAREAGRRSMCQSNLKEVGMAMLMYTQDYDQTYPPANLWCDLTRPYVQKPDTFRCPSARSLRSGYAMNSALSASSINDIDEPNDTVLLFDADRGWNAAGGKDLLVNRHLSGANYATATGRTVWRPRPEMLKWQVDARR